MGPHDLSARFDAVSDRLATSGAALDRLDPGPRAFGADGPGRLGELGRTLHLALAAGLAARSDEAVAHGVRLADTADALRRVSGGYADAERAAQDRHAGGVA
ncbi:MAG TPA: hypothetical protein VK453_20840 [Micromonosporaceae bacterium]|nr:hypothetical protein [Micromonosporaceae bacterium]